MDPILPPGFTLLQVVPRLEGGGVERATLDLSRQVTLAGGRSLVASRGGGLERELVDSGGTLVRMPFQAKDPASLLANAARLAWLVKRERVSLIHVRSRAPAFSALLAGRWARVPVATTYHGVYGAKGPLKRWYNGVMTRGDLVIANSEFTRGHLIAEHRPDPARIAVVHEGIDTAWFDPAAVSPERVAGARQALGLQDDGRPVLLLGARLTGWKGQAVAIQALAAARADPAPILVLAGGTESPAYAHSLRALAAQQSVLDRVCFAGPVQDMPAAFAVADVVLAPSLKAESFGRGVVEAMAMGRVVIASAIGAHLETVVAGETGWLVEAGDVQSCSRAITAALSTSPRMRAQMGERARARAVGGYDVGAMAGATFQAYRALLDRR